MNISVALCTYNRCELLEEVLQHLKTIQKPKNLLWNFIIVNNNSEDNTELIIDKFKKDLPIQYLLEKNQGLSHARNAALNQAVKSNSEYIIWIDDDVFPDNDWLIEYENIFSLRPDVAFFGGSISAKFEGEPPEWLKKNIDLLKFAYAITYETGNELGEVRMPNLPIGANFALKIDSINGIRFSTDLGIQGKKRLNGEETAMMEQLLEIGRTGLWLPVARVKHYIPKSRQTLTYLGTYYRSVGRTETVQLQESGSYWKKKWALRKAITNAAITAIYFIRFGSNSNLFIRHLIVTQTSFGRFFS